jgi:hypothetical protein
VYTDGIIISPEAWSLADIEVTPQSNDTELKETLWHEMNHFMYFTNWDYTQTSEPNLWFTEGLAEYFAGNYGRLVEVGNFNKLNLTEDFRGGGNTEYWAGLSAYLCLEQNSGVLIISYIPPCLPAIGTAGTVYDLWEMVRTTTIKLMTTDA